MNDNRVNDILNKEIQADHVAYEMATTLRTAITKISDKAWTFFEHFLKIVLYPEDVNQNKWRTELATKVAECARLKNTATNKKFREDIYAALFTTYCSSFEDFVDAASDFEEDFKAEGFSSVELSGTELNQKYQQLLKLKSILLPLMTQKDNYSVEFYKQRISEVL